MSHHLPKDFHTLTPHIVVPNVAEAMTFYKQAFGAEEQVRVLMPGKDLVMHAQMRIGNSVLMLGGEFPPNALSPKSRGGTSTYLHLYLPDADAACERAVKAGCVIRMPVSDTFWGDRYGIVEDPFGHQWSLATHQHDYTPEQIAANAQAFFAKMAKG